MSPLTFKGAAEMPLFSRSGDTMEWNLTGSWRYLRPRYLDKDAPCSEACPAAEDIPLVELLASRGKFEEAWHRIREENPLTAVCGRVCFHPCERACNRGRYDDAVGINSLERHISDHAMRNRVAPIAPLPPSSGRRVAVVGAGPAGLAAAWFLRRNGHAVDLFDAREKPGGLLRYGIPSYRLPEPVLEWEVNLILDTGVQFKPGKTLGENLLWDELAGYDAVFLAIGAWQPNPLGVEGEELARDGLAFLEAVRRGNAPAVEGPVAVIGGGNTAMDVARTLLRLGAEPAIYYRRRLEDLPALPEEVRELTEEGIPIHPLVAPRALTKDGTNVNLALTPMEIVGEGEGSRAKIAPSGAPEQFIPVTAVFSATGFAPSEGLPRGAAQSLGPFLSRLTPEAELGITVPVYLGGDLTNDNRTVVTAIASGKAAAVAIDAGFRNLDPAERLEAGLVGTKGALSLNRLEREDRDARQRHVVGFEELNTIYFRYQGRTERPGLTLQERRTSFDEVKMRIAASMAMSEAERCFRCGICDQCDNCYLFCPDMSVLKPSGDEPRRIDFNYCKGCGVCVVECPRNAMILEGEPR